MLTCPYCQHPNPPQAETCASCGSSLAPDVLPNGTKLFGNTLEIESVLGRGGFGIVYLGKHLLHQKRIAIKELYPQNLASRAANLAVVVASGRQTEWQSALDRTTREAALLRQLKHKSATKLFAVWEENGTAYMGLELLNGETLEERIQTGRYLSAEEARAALLTILEVLEELHGLGYLHRDIKPANIMFTPERVELIDFGSFTEFKTGERVRVSSRMLTPEYAPLEQFGQEVELSPATDLYALAATFCEAMTGTRVPSALERANGASLEPSLLAVRRVSRELGDVLERALELRMEFRFSHAQSMQQLIQGHSIRHGLIPASMPNKNLGTKPKGVTPQNINSMLVKDTILLTLIGLIIFLPLFLLIQPFLGSKTSTYTPPQSTTPIGSQTSTIKPPKVPPAPVLLNLVTPTPTRVLSYKNILQYHQSKKIFVENNHFLKLENYKNILILKYPKKIAQNKISISDYQLSDDLNFLLLKENICENINKCESFLRFENLKLRQTEKIVPWNFKKSSLKAIDIQDKVHFRYSNNKFFTISQSGYFRVYDTQGNSLYEEYLADTLTYMTLSDDKNYIYIKKETGKLKYKNRNFRQGFFVFDAKKLSLYDFIVFDNLGDFFIVTTPKDKFGFIIYSDRGYEYSEYNLKTNKSAPYQQLELPFDKYEITNFRRSDVSILFFESDDPNINKFAYGVKRIGDGKIELTFVYTSFESNFYAEYIKSDKISLFFKNSNSHKLIVIDFLGNSYFEKENIKKVIFNKKSLRDKGIVYFVNRDSLFNYVQIVKPNFM